MFGDIMGMMGKLKETQQKVEETKKRLDFVLIDEKSADGLLEVTLTANRKIKNITVSISIFIIINKINYCFINAFKHSAT